PISELEPTPEEELEPPSPGTELDANENSSENIGENELAEGEGEEGEGEEQKGGAGKKAKMFGKIQVLSDRMLNSNPNNNFFLLSSVTVFDQPISVATKKQILQKFNQRPENVFGQEARIIVMDSGFKEGIDLFDIKYIHIFEPPVNAADQKQVIGRGTRLCGQKGLVFHPTQGWPLHVFIYDLDIPDKMQSSFLGATTAFDLYLKAMNLDIRLFRFAADLEETSIYGSADYELNRKIHDFVITGNKSTSPKMSGGGPKKARLIIDRTMPPIMVSTKGDSLTLMGNENSPQLQVRLPSGQLISGVELKQMNFNEMRKYIKHYFGDLSWSDVQMENMCIDKTEVKGVNPKQKGGASTVIKYTPTQDFVRRYFTPQAPVKGMLLWHSVGTGKTCSAIAAASSSFEPQNYTILWVTRTTLKNDIWKNMFDQICSEAIKLKLAELEKQGLSMPEVQAKRMRLLSKNWSIRPMSYKQFSNLVSKENNFYKALVKINGPADPLRKTLLVIDEAHKLYGGGDLSSLERPDMKALHAALMNSYAVSGPDSVRLLLMTATPITENPMELIKLMNLCKLPDQQMPTDFPLFSQEFLDEEGGFTAEGRRKYLDAIAGHISYLNREKDARQFSQPRIQSIRSPLIKDVQDAMDLDKRFARSILNKEVDELKVQIKAENDKIDADLKDLDASRFYSLRDKCDDLEGKEQ
ncbi:MAG: DEAD/DEAH box helicase family protein, partial [Bacteroidota bacterium]